MGSKNQKSGGGSKAMPAPSRQETKTTAKTAASTGTLNKQNVQDMRQAGVQQTRIQEIRGQNAANVAKNTASQTASANTNANIAKALDDRFNSGGTIGREFYNTPEFQSVLNQNLNTDGTKLSEADVAKYSMAKGYGLGEQYMSEFGKGTAPRQASNIRQAIKIAAANDPLNILTRKEAMGIYDDYQGKKNLDALKFTGILDKMNANFDKRGNQSIGLAGGALNYLSKNMDGMSRFNQMLGGSPAGGLTSSLMGMSDSWATSGAGDGASTYKVPGTGKFNRGDTIYGQYSTGQFKDSPGMGKPWKDTKWGQPAEVAYQPWAQPSGPVNTNTGGDEEVVTTTTVPTPPEEQTPTTPSAGQFGAGLDFASFASGWRSKKGQRAKAGTNAQGYGSMRTSPWSSFGTGINFGYS